MHQIYDPRLTAPRTGPLTAQSTPLKMPSRPGHPPFCPSTPTRKRHENNHHNAQTNPIGAIPNPKHTFLPYLSAGEKKKKRKKKKVLTSSFRGGFPQMDEETTPDLRLDTDGTRVKA
ncbi:hypothetical protein B0T14DRAFT_521939 [Immersiella caudata]|uniref:Uncharacterized protein n=1 Tax=Immersiella caudata TaxID=314043 RepID=A0AA40C0R1_9PEZI|nr:hypothetical protein B0T14DRAFT_521939 [Immersiella caudata]